MTNEDIDKLERRELDRAFAFAMLSTPDVPCLIAYLHGKLVFAGSPDAEVPHYCSSLDAVLAALPDEWRIALQGCNDGTGWVATVAPQLTSAIGPTPATALCRAALKAKAPAPPEAT